MAQGGAELGKLVVPIVIDKGQLRNELQGAGRAIESEAKSFGRRLESVSMGFTKAVSVPLTGLVTTIYVATNALEGAFRTIRSGTGATGKALSGLRGDFMSMLKTSDESVGSIARVIADLNTRMGLTGEPLQKLAGQFLDLEGLVGEMATQTVPLVTRMFGDWGIAAEDSAKRLDHLYRLSQLTGVSIGGLASQLTFFGAPLRQMGFDWEHAAAMLAKWEKEGVNANLILASLRIGLLKLSEAGAADPAAAFQEMIDKIKSAATLGEGNLIAKSLFGGRSAADMAAAIRENRIEYDDLLESMRNSTDTISGVKAETETWGEVLGNLKNRLIAMWEPLTGVSATLRSDFKGAAVTAIEWLDVLIDKFIELPSWIKTSTGILVTFGLVVGPTGVLVGKLATQLGLLSVAGLKWGLAVGGMVTAGVLVYENFREIQTGILELYAVFVETIRNIMLTTADAFGAARDWMLQGEGILGALGASVYDVYASLFGDPQSQIQKAVSGLSKAAADANRAAVESMHKSADAAQDTSGEIEQAISQVEKRLSELDTKGAPLSEAEIKTLYDELFGGAGDAAGGAADKLLDVATAFDDAQKAAVAFRLSVRPEEGFLDAVEQLRKVALEFPDVIDSGVMTDKILALWDQFGLSGQTAFKRVAEQLMRLGPAVQVAVPALLDKAKLQEGLGSWQRLDKTFQSMHDSLLEAKDAAEKAKDKIAERWEKVLGTMGATVNLLGAMGDKFQTLARVASAATNIVAISVDMLTGRVNILQGALQIATELFGLFGDEGEKELSMMDRMTQDLDEALTQFGDRFTDELANLIRDGKAQWSDFADFVIDELLRISLQYAITEPLLQGVRMLYGSVFAKGGTFESGHVVPLAKGDVVTRPMVFPMARGLGLMGEAGPEAVMPLTRTADGSLGVKAAGAAVNVEIHNYSGAAATVEETVDPNGVRRVMVTIQNAVRKGLAAGTFDPDLSSAYGLRRVGVTR